MLPGSSGMVKGGRRARDAGLRSFSHFLVCKECGGSLAEATPRQLACVRCHARVERHGSIVDFVAGASTTALDDIDYDKFYAVSAEYSLSLYNTLEQSAGARWPVDFGDVLEIGVGTGGFSMALLGRAKPSHAVLTDVSVRMLQICQRRLEGMRELSRDAVQYATYSGTEDCFRASAFDTCCGTSVVHHIADVPRLLAQVHRLLKPGGRAFFMEPNLAFHRALTRTMAGIAAEWLLNDTVPEQDISRILNWTAEVHCNIVNSGDIEVLAEREDKHLFVGEAFERAAKAAGFNQAIALSTPVDPTGASTAETYLNQCDVGIGTMTLLRKAWPAAQAAHFRSLRQNDRSPSYLFWLEKGLSKQRVRRTAPAAAPHSAATPAATRVRPRLWLMLTLRSFDRSAELRVNGWCVSQDTLRAVEVSLCGVVKRLPIWLPRPDVQRSINQAGTYPPLHALCCGIDGSIVVANEAAAGDLIEISVRVLPVDGPAFSVQRCLLKPDGDSVVLE